MISNIAEGFDRGGRPEFARFLSIAKGSAAEVKSLLYVGFDAGYLDEARMNELHALVEEVQHVVGGLRNAVARQRDADQPES